MHQMGVSEARYMSDRDTGLTSPSEAATRDAAKQRHAPERAERTPHASGSYPRTPVMPAMSPACYGGYLMRECLKSRPVQMGLGLFVFGAGRCSSS